MLGDDRGEGACGQRTPAARLPPDHRSARSARASLVHELSALPAFVKLESDAAIAQTPLQPYLRHTSRGKIADEIEHLARVRERETFELHLRVTGSALLDLDRVPQSPRRSTCACALVIEIPPIPHHGMEVPHELSVIAQALDRRRSEAREFGSLVIAAEAGSGFSALSHRVRRVFSCHSVSRPG